jgi:hypothetical protein
MRWGSTKRTIEKNDTFTFGYAAQMPRGKNSASSRTNEHRSHLHVIDPEPETLQDTFFSLKRKFYSG